MKKAFIIFASLIVCISLFLSCTSTPETTTATSSPTGTVPRSVLVGPQTPSTETPQFGGIMKTIWGGSPSNIGAPWKLLSGPNKFMSRFAIEYLTGIDSKGNPAPQLASSWVADEANKTYTFTLRDNVVFHDNTPFDAEAVKWNLEKSISVKNPAVAKVTSVDVIDKTHIKLTLSQWDPLFLISLQGNAAGAMVSPTAAKKLIADGKEDDIARNPVGTGPFKLVSFTPNQLLKYERFTNYWQKPLPYLDGVECRFVNDPVVALAAFKNKEADYYEGVLPKDVAALRAEGYKITQMTSALFGICGDSRNSESLWSKKEFRQAVAYALDVKTLVKSVFGGVYESINQFAAPGLWGYDSSIQGYPYDLAKAKTMLATFGISAATPKTFKFTFAEGPQTKDMYTAIQGELAKVGINLEFDIITGAAWNAFRMGDMKDQMSEYNMSYQLEFAYSDTLKQSAMKDSVWYKWVWTSDAYNAALQEMLPESNWDKRIAQYKQLNKMLVDDCIVVPTWLKYNFKGLQTYLMDMGCGDVTGEYLPEIAWMKAH